MFHHPASNAGPLFEELTPWLHQDEVAPDAAEIRRLRAIATKILNADLGEGYMACSAVSALVWDVKDTLDNVTEALKYDRSFESLVNAIVSLCFCNRHDLAVPYAREIVRMGLHHQEAYNVATDVFLATGEFSQAAAAFSEVQARDLGLNLEVDFTEITSTIKRLNLSEGQIQRELAVAREVLTEARIRVRGSGITFDANGLGELTCCLIYMFYGSFEQELSLEDSLAVRLSAYESWDPSRLSIQLHYESVDADIAG